MSPPGESPVEVLLIHKDPPCRKCRKAERVLQELVTKHPSDVTLRGITSKDPEATGFGAIVTPMILMGGKLVTAGRVPRLAGLETLLERQRGTSA